MPVYINVPDGIEFNRPVRMPAAVLSAPIRRVEADQPERPRKPLDPAKLNRSIRAAAERRRRELEQEAKEEARRPECDAGTQETRDRIGEDPLLRMLSRDQLTQEQYTAAVQIAAGYRLDTLGMDAQIASYGHRIPGGPGSSSVEYAARIVSAYAAWRREFDKREQAAGRMLHGCRKSRLLAVMDVIVNGLTCRQVEGRRRMKNGTLASILRDALDLYDDVRSGKVKRQMAA
ncbi:hypothetical protein ABNQ39_20665 [Azospirillum sp. A26]|uniref:hypothetical protein n=1 Tax=Azospirillum sp. A26 TaxID=3160607 RepID=UPI00366C22B2